MELAGLKIIFENRMSRIKRSREVIGEAEKSDKLYELKIFVGDESAEAHSVLQDYMWHRRYGHISKNSLVSQKLS